MQPLASSYLSQKQSSTPAAVVYSEKALQQDLERLRSLWEQFQSSRHRDSVYLYLTGVFDLVRWWVAEGRAVGRARRALRWQPREGGMFLEPFSVIIFCTSSGKGANKKARSKWSRVLRFAAEYKNDREPLDAFIKRKGGINGCAALYTRRLGRRAKTH